MLPRFHAGDCRCVTRSGPSSSAGTHPRPWPRYRLQGEWSCRGRPDSRGLYQDRRGRLRDQGRRAGGARSARSGSGWRPSAPSGPGRPPARWSRPGAPPAQRAVGLALLGGPGQASVRLPQQPGQRPGGHRRAQHLAHQRCRPVDRQVLGGQQVAAQRPHPGPVVDRRGHPVGEARGGGLPTGARRCSATCSTIRRRTWGSSCTWRRATPTTGPSSGAAPHARQEVATGMRRSSGWVTWANAAPGLPGCLPGLRAPGCPGHGWPGWFARPVGRWRPLRGLRGLPKPSPQLGDLVVEPLVLGLQRGHVHVQLPESFGHPGWDLLVGRDGRKRCCWDRNDLLAGSTGRRCGGMSCCGTCGSWFGGSCLAWLPGTTVGNPAVEGHDEPWWAWHPAPWLGGAAWRPSRPGPSHSASEVTCRTSGHLLSVVIRRNRGDARWPLPIGVVVNHPHTPEPAAAEGSPR
jgi:hypothetical protein